MKQSELDLWRDCYNGGYTQGDQWLINLFANEYYYTDTSQELLEPEMDYSC